MSYQSCQVHQHSSWRADKATSVSWCPQAVRGAVCSTCSHIWPIPPAKLAVRNTEVMEKSNCYKLTFNEPTCYFYLKIASLSLFVYVSFQLYFDHHCFAVAMI